MSSNQGIQSQVPGGGIDPNQSSQMRRLKVFPHPECHVYQSFHHNFFFLFFHLVEKCGEARSASSVAHTPFAQLLATNRVLRHHPTSAPLRLALLSKLRLRHPAIPGQRLAASALSRSANF